MGAERVGEGELQHGVEGAGVRWVGAVGGVLGAVLIEYWGGDRVGGWRIVGWRSWRWVGVRRGGVREGDLATWGFYGETFG